MKDRLAKLKQYNTWVGLLLLAQGVGMWILSGAKHFKLPVTTDYLQWDSMLNKPVSEVHNVGEIEIGYIVAAFLLISGLFLILNATVFNKTYNKMLLKGMNLFRWTEYLLTSSMMIVVIAMLCGVYDLSGLIMLFALNAAMIMFGWMMETHNQNASKVDWTPFVFGSVVGIVPWIVMAMYFYSALLSNASAVPAFVYWIFWSLFVFFNIFAINMVLQYKKVGKWKDYMYGEYVYITLSLVAKALLAWQVWSGTLR